MESGVLHQVDTYFGVSRGRLKLRRERGEAARLIAYERPDLILHKESRYRLVEIEDPADLEEALAGALGITAVVSKVRRLFLLDGMRIHLDEVDGHGRFIEFEAVASSADADLARFESALADLRRAFGIADAELISGSYCDLALAAATPSARGRAGRGSGG